MPVLPHVGPQARCLGWATRSVDADLRDENLGGGATTSKLSDVKLTVCGVQTSGLITSRAGRAPVGAIATHGGGVTT